jgi:hypothetical protein
MNNTLILVKEKEKRDTMMEKERERIGLKVKTA